MRIHPAICPRDTLPHPLLVALTLSSLLLLLFSSFFYPFLNAPTSLSSLCHTSCPPFLISSIFPQFDPPLAHSVSHGTSTTCFLCSLFCHLPLSILSKSVGGVFVLWRGGPGCHVKVLPYSDRRLSDFAWARSIGVDTEGDPWLVTLETNFIKMNLSRGTILTAA